METRNATIKSLKPGSYVLVEGEPSKVVSVTLSKPGKHGSMKARMEAVGIFDNRKRMVLKPADSEVQVPIIEKRKGQIISISGDFVQLMDMEDYSTFEANIPEDMKGKLEPGTETGYWRLGKRVLLKEA